MNDKDQKIIELLTEIRDLLKSQLKPMKVGSPVSSRADKKLVKDVCTPGEWGDVEMPFSKHRGKPLSLLPVGFVEWLADKWEPKGYDNDEAIQQVIRAVMVDEEGRDKGKDDKPPENPDEDDVPF